MPQAYRYISHHHDRIKSQNSSSKFKIFLKFRGPCIVSCIFRYISNNMQRYTAHLFLENCSTYIGWYLHPSSGAHTTLSTASGTCQTVTATCRYRGRGGTATIIRSTLNCIYSIWHLSNRYCYLSLSWKSCNFSSNTPTIEAGSSNGLISARCC